MNLLYPPAAWRKRFTLFFLCLVFLNSFTSYAGYNFLGLHENTNIQSSELTQSAPFFARNFIGIPGVTNFEVAKGSKKSLRKQTLSKSDPDEGVSSNSNEFRQFIEEVFTDEKGVIRGVYVPGIFSFPVIQQPPGNDIFVSNKSGMVTQFRQADLHGVIGLLAHNYLSGKQFSELEIGQEVIIIYGNKEIKPYRVTRIDAFQKLNPSNLYSNYLDLNSLQEFSTSQVFNKFYQDSNHLIFQTCLEMEGRLDWGLLFVTASPIDR